VKLPARSPSGARRAILRGDPAAISWPEELPPAPADECAGEVLIVFAVLGAVLVLVIALVAVGGVVGRLRVEPQRNVFENDEALEFVAQALPDQMTAELSYDEVQRIMRLHIDYLHSQGVARSGGDLPDGGGPQVVEREDAVASILRRAALVDFYPRPEAVRRVVEAQLAYFEAIGAISPVSAPELADLADLAEEPARAGDQPDEPEPGATNGSGRAPRPADGA
jgi:hypothetical protein